MCAQHQLLRVSAGGQLLVLLHCTKVGLNGRCYENRSTFFSLDKKIFANIHFLFLFLFFLGGHHFFVCFGFCLFVFVFFGEKYFLFICFFYSFGFFLISIDEPLYTVFLSNAFFVLSLSLIFYNALCFSVTEMFTLFILTKITTVPDFVLQQKVQT